MQIVMKIKKMVDSKFMQSILIFSLVPLISDCVKLKTGFQKSKVVSKNIFSLNI